jgi:hypothetical protein
LLPLLSFSVEMTVPLTASDDVGGVLRYLDLGGLSHGL